MTDPKSFGKKGEELAARHLLRLGYKILQKNFRTPAGEIDIVAMDGRTLVFIEVKSRRDGSFGSPELAVNHHKRKRIERAALIYLARNKKEDAPCRFDVVSISAGGETNPEVSVIKDAFELAGGY